MFSTHGATVRGFEFVMAESASPESVSKEITVDVIVIGGGVAALWTANALKASGRSVLVLTNTPLGEGQSLAAQGVIHGGLKYAVGGKLTDSSEALAGMPSRWLAAIEGKGDVDLSGAKVISDHQLMWSLPNVVSQVVGFFGSKALRGRANSLHRNDYPEVFDTNEYRGKIFRIEEPVIDPVSVMSALGRGVANESYQVDWNSNAKWEIDRGNVTGILLRQKNAKSIRIKATRYLLAGGAGNGPILEKVGISSPKQQLRPLHQLIIRKVGLPDFFSVCVGTGPKPPLVTTTHQDSQGRTVWYVGGDIAEQQGVERSESEQIEAGKTLFAQLLPWVDLTGAEWFTWRGNRAEPETGTGDRPAGAYCETVGNLLVAWPTKLALAPNLADQVCETVGAGCHNEAPPLLLDRPQLGTPPWDLA